MLTVNPSELHGLLTDVLRTAGADRTLPMLNGLLLHSDVKDDTTVLVGTSTDRFRLGQAHIPATGEIPPTFVSAAQVKQLLDTLKPYVKTHDLLSEVTVTERTKLTLKLPGDIVLPAVTITVHCEDDSGFPKSAKVMGTELVTGSGQLGFNPAYVASFAAIAKRRGENLRVEMSYTTKPSVFYIGTQYRGLLMPVRLDTQSLVTAPVLLPPAEKPKTDEPAAA